VFSEAEINVRGRRSQRLKINYRTTERICQAAVNVIQGIDFSDFDDGVESIKGYVSLRKGQEPSYEVYKTKAAETTALMERLNAHLAVTDGDRNSIAASEICIATRRSRGTAHPPIIPSFWRRSFYGRGAVPQGSWSVATSTGHGSRPVRIISGHSPPAHYSFMLEA
jgi:hypothetical protein